MKIERVRGLEVLDSRGRPTVEAEVRLANGITARAIAPSGASTGKHEAVELRDKDPHRYGGFGVATAVANVNGDIQAALVGLDVFDQAAVDAQLRERKQLGANATLAASMAVAHAAAAARGVELWRYLAADQSACRVPTPMVNLISGGLHASRNLDVQDFLIIPANCDSYAQALERVVHVYNNCKRMIDSRDLSSLKADEGGFSPELKTNESALELVMDAIYAACLTPGKDIVIALDIAATHFYYDDLYHFSRDHHAMSSADMVELLVRWCDKYPIVSIEDGLAEDDWPGWRLLTDRLGARVQLIGDDLFTTNPKRVRRGIEEKCANGVLVKMNQIGTLTETLEVMRLASEHGMRCVVSARSGETEDTTMADLAVATGAGQIKVGSVNQSERLAKYNQLLRIERDGVPYARVY